MKNKTYPLLQSQLGIFIECQEEPTLTRYNLGGKMTLPDSIDLARLEHAVQTVINARHILHTRFFIDDEGCPRQYEDKEMEIPVRRLQLKEKDVDTFIEQELMCPFQLIGDEPLCRFAIVETETHHYFFYCIHHTICDGTTFFTLFPKLDLAKAYEELPLTPETKSLADYAIEEQQLMTSDSFAEASKYYKEKFAEAETTELSNANGARIGNVVCIYDRIEADTINAWCEKHQLRPNNLLQAAFSLVLSRMSRQQKVVYTSVRHGRFDKALLQSYGMFVKTVPVLVDTKPDMTVADYVKAVAEEWKSTYRMADYSFSQFCRDTQLQPTITFAYQGNQMVKEYTIGGERVSMQQLTCVRSAMDLTCFIYNYPQHYEIRMESSDALYDEDFLCHFAQALKVCVNELITHTESQLKDIEIVSEEEKKDLITLGAGEELQYDKSETLIDLFEKQVNISPDAEAVVFKDRHYTYRQIDDMTNRLATHLQNKYNVKRESVVGVMIDRSEWMVIYPLAIMKAGGVYMPLDFHFPEDRLSYMIADAGVELILSEGDLVKETLPNFGGNVMNIDEALSIVTADNADSDISAEEKPQPSNAFIILYTSGSTGRPKGCVLEHHSIVNFCHWYIKDFELTNADRGVAYANFGFDAHMMDIYPLLSSGGTVYILPSDVRMDLTAIHRYMEDNHVTIAFFTTQIGVQMASLFEYKYLRLMSVGGEKLIPIKKPSFKFYNAYGPTECTIFATVYQQKYDNEDAPIGRPLAECQLYVLDTTMHMVPRGVAGELCIAGEGVGREYLNNPEMTAAKFITVNGIRMYRTGDLVRWDNNGDIVYIRRMDNQVKLRGLRIEIGEIETVLSRFDGIDTSAVAVQEVNGVQMLCAYYTSESDIDEDALKAFLGESLTDFMVPEIYVRMDKLPLTPNGKVNRRALPLPKVEKGEIVAAETDAEKKLFEIVSKQLGTEDFGVTTNLISMGLTSIGAIKLSVNIQKQMGVQLKTKDIMKNPTIRYWAGIMGEEHSDVDEMHTYPVQEYYPLTPNQLGVYIDWEQNREDLQYNIPTLLKFEHIDAERLKDSLIKVVNAHEYMKMRLERHNGEVMQKRCDNAEPIVSIQTLTEEPSSEFFQQRIRPFNILEESLYRIEIYVYKDATWLLMDVHHIAFDGGSLSAFRRDLQQAYNGENIEKEAFTAYDYALYNQAWQQSEAYTQAENYFAQVMDGAEAVKYPVSNAKKQLHGLKKTAIEVDRKEIKSCAQKLGVTESSFFMTAIMQVLHRFTREHDIMITTISNGRSSAIMGNTVGMFVQTLPVVSHYANTSISDAVKEMHQQMLTTIDNDKYPFTKIVEKYGVRPQIMVAYQGDVLDGNPHLGDSEGIVGKLKLEIVKLPIIIDIWHRSNEKIEIVMEYDASQYLEKEMIQFGRAISTVAKRMAKADVHQPITSLSTVDDEQQKGLVALGAGKHIDIDITETFVSLFVKQARRTPENLAVADKDSTLTYRQMDEYSNLIAHRFVELGIKPNDLVCVMLERTKEFPLTVLSLHKSGAAYVPLDFDYPNARLSYMLENSESKLLITTHDVLESKIAEGEFDLAQARPFFLDDLFAETNIAKQAANAEPIDLSSPEGVAYMIYTSGSTGTPKGARLHHAGLRNFIASIIDIAQLTEKDRISGHRSFSFDAHIQDLFPVLTVGGSFHVMPSEIRKDLGAIRQFLFDHQITGGGYSTVVTCMLLNTYPDIPVRYITGGGEKMAGVYSDHIEIINAYGTTECTDDTSFYIIKPGSHVENIPVGKTFPNCWNFVIDETGHLLPQGQAGELCIAGIQVGLGYWHRDDLTQKAFVDCPFVDKDSWGRKVRMYHTGDLCRWNAEGQLEYISRIDHQVKLRGYRIEMGEVENAICRFEGVRNAVAVVKEINGLQHLCAYYTADVEIDEHKLKDFLSASLTDYMVPDAYMQMESLPLTPNGKVNRKALPEPTIKAVEQVAFEEPEGEKEIDIANAFAEVLGSERISANDNFFLLGGTSISAIKVVAALTLKGYQLAFKDVFACKTPRILAAYLRGVRYNKLLL